MMNWYVLLFFSFVLAGMVTLVTFEILVWRLYFYHQRAWGAAGSPTPLFVTDNYWGGFLTKWALWGKFLFETPAWIRGDRISRLLLYLHRLAAVILLLGPVSFVIIALLLS
jgi:hypothetical protein